MACFAEPLSSLLLFLHPFGRKALLPRERWQALSVAGLLLTGLGFGLAAWRGDETLLIFAFVAVLLSLPYKEAFGIATRRARRLMLGYAVAMTLLGSVTAGLLWTTERRIEELVSLASSRALPAILFVGFGLLASLGSILLSSWLEARDERN